MGIQDRTPPSLSILLIDVQACGIDAEEKGWSSTVGLSVFSSLVVNLIHTLNFND